MAYGDQATTTAKLNITVPSEHIRPPSNMFPATSPIHVPALPADQSASPSPPAAGNNILTPSPTLLTFSGTSLSVVGLDISNSCDLDSLQPDRLGTVNGSGTPALASATPSELQSGAPVTSLAVGGMSVSAGGPRTTVGDGLVSM